MHAMWRNGTMDGRITILGIESSCDETAAAVVRGEVTGAEARGPMPSGSIWWRCGRWKRPGSGWASSTRWR